MKRKILFLFLTLIAFQVNAQESNLGNKLNSKTEFGFKVMKFVFLVICIQLLDNSIAFNPTD